MVGTVEAQGPVIAAAHAQLEFVVDRVTRRVDCCDVGDVPFEASGAVRESESWQHKVNYSGYYWAATVRRHVWCESLYERSALMRLDRDRSVAGIAAQPMWIHWPTTPPSKHAPDFFVRFADGAGVVVDVRSAEQIDDSTAAVFDRTRQLCDRLGWGYLVVSDIGAVEQRNLRLLSAYRFDRWRSADATRRLKDRSGEGGALSEWVSWLRGSAPDPLGAVFSAVWWNELVADVAQPMTLATVAKAAWP